MLIFDVTALLYYVKISWDLNMINLMLGDSTPLRYCWGFAQNIFRVGFGLRLKLA